MFHYLLYGANVLHSVLMSYLGPSVCKYTVMNRKRETMKLLAGVQQLLLMHVLLCVHVLMKIQFPVVNERHLVLN